MCIKFQEVMLEMLKPSSSFHDCSVACEELHEAIIYARDSAYMDLASTEADSILVEICGMLDYLNKHVFYELEKTFMEAGK